MTINCIFHYKKMSAEIKMLELVFKDEFSTDKKEFSTDLIKSNIISKSYDDID